jgi:hypothetical protein
MFLKLTKKQIDKPRLKAETKLKPSRMFLKTRERKTKIVFLAKNQNSGTPKSFPLH